MLKKPTAAQAAAINADDHKIAVSASAGSGKTTTMIERIARILQMKGDDQKPRTTIDQLLVLTFTEESAKDMRKKLKKQLGDRLSPVELQAAAIGTFHSFCANIVRAWFTVAGVNPSFTVMDEIESNKLKAQIFEKVVIDHYDQATAAIDLFAATRTLSGLRDVVFQINEFLNTRADAAAWLEDTAFRCYEPNLDRNPAVQGLINYYHQLTAKYQAAIIDLAHPSPEVTAVLNVCEQVLAAQTYAAMQKLAGISLDKLKKVSEWLDADYERFKDLRSGFRDDVLKPLGEQFAFDASQIQADIATDRRIVEQLLFLVQQFDAAYSAKKAEYKQLDFADLEKYALKVLADPDAVASIRGQFKYIFVDEGQDTNPVQFKIIDLLRGDDKFFYIVGDVKQSIYGFRDCEPELFEQMTTEALIRTLHFNQNFRSNDQILRFVNDVFTPLMPDYQTNHAFVLAEQRAALPESSAVKIELAPERDLDAQMELVYRQIVGTKRPWGDFAILSETTRHFAALQKYLAERGVPSVIDRASDATQEPAVVLLNNFLFAAMNPSNELAYYLTLQHLFHCSNDDLALIRLGQKTVPAIDAKLAEYRNYGRTMSTYEVMTRAATEFGLLNVPAVAAFLSAIRGVSDFDTVARYLYLIEHQLVKIDINVGANVTDAVKIMTIHHAKGLEFPVVILFNMGALWSQHHDDAKIALDKNLGLCVVSVDTATYTQKSPVLRLGIKKQQQVALLTEKQRLLYVALTRPKEYLYIVGSWQNKWRVQPNCMLDLLNPTTATRYDTVTPSPVKVAAAVNATTDAVVVSPIKPSAVLAKQSVTALATNAEPFADTVVAVKYDDFDGVAGGKEFGTAFHKQVQYGDLPPAVAALVAGYTVYREMPFLYRQDQTIVQGIMDLVAVKGQDAIIVDYKTTRLPVDALVQKYRPQLDLYAAALPQYRCQKYLYSTVHNRVIVVS